MPRVITTVSSAVAVNSFTVFQPDFGTSPTADSANDTLTLTSSDGSVTITGDATTDTINFTSGSLSVGFTTGSIPYASAGLLKEDFTTAFGYNQTLGGLYLGTSLSGITGSVKAAVYPSQDVYAIFGQTALWTPSLIPGSNVWSNVNQQGLLSFGLAQLATGETVLNSPSLLQLNISSNTQLGIISGLLATGTDVEFRFTGLTNYIGFKGHTNSPALTYRLWNSDTAGGVVMSNGSAGLSLGLITAANIASGASIPVASLANLSATRLVVTNGSGVLTTNAGTVQTPGIVYCSTSGNGVSTDQFLLFDTGNVAIQLGTTTTIGSMTIFNSRNVPAVSMQANSGQTAGMMVVRSNAGATLSGIDTSGRFQAPASTTSSAANPGFHFISDTNSGFSTVGNDRPIITAGGVACLEGGTQTITTLLGVKHHRTATSASLTATVADHHIAVESTSASIMITLPPASLFSSATLSRVFVIKDESGAAGTNAIGVISSSGLIDGVSLLQITANYGVARLYSNATAYFTW